MTDELKTYDDMIRYKAKKYDKLKEAVGKIKEEIKNLDSDFADEEYRSGVAYGIMKVNQIIDNHTKEV